MATLRITEYADLAESVHGDPIPIPQEPPVTEQAVVTFTTATQSAAFKANTKYVRLEASADAYVLFGANPTATAASGRIPSGTVEYRGVGKGNATKLSVYDGSS